MKTHDLPYAIDDIVLNVKADLLGRGIIDRDGGVADLQAFKVALVSSVKKPITVGPGDDLRAKLANGHDVLTQIRVFVVMSNGRPLHAGFRKGRIAVEEIEKLVEYVIRRADDGDLLHHIYGLYFVVGFILCDYYAK